MFDREHPSKSITELVQYLSDQNDAAHFLYRGQTREYPGPLLPSLYRNYKGTGRKFSSEDMEYKHSCRKSGHSFVALDPFSGWFPMRAIESLRALREPHSRATSQAFRMLTDPECDAAAVSGRMLNFISDRLNIDDQHALELIAESLQSMADTHHRRYVRDVVFSLPLGTLIGTSVAQQYGFSSGYLDVTASIPVAAFFATHSATDYRAVSENDTPGIIYRFPHTATPGWSKQRTMNTAIEAFPQSVLIKEVVSPFEATNSDYVAALQAYVQYALDSIETANPLWDSYFRLPKGWLKYSRMGRQAAAVLIPDILVEPMITTAEPITFCHSRLIIAQLFAVEDLASRPGLEKYYFKHSLGAATELGLCREELWPRDADFFLMLTKSLLMMGADVGTLYPNTGYFLSRIPNRPDLVDLGYSDSVDDLATPK